MTEQKAETLSQELSQVLEEIVTIPEEEVKRAVMWLEIQTDEMCIMKRRRLP